MEGNTISDADAFQHIRRSNYFGNDCFSGDDSFPSRGEQYFESQRYHGKNNNRSRNMDWNRDRPIRGTGRGNFNEGIRDRFIEETPQRPPPFLADVYNTSRHSYANNSQRAMNLMAATSNNMQWGVNRIDLMTTIPNNMPNNPGFTPIPSAADMEMIPTSSSAAKPYAYMGMSENNMFGQRSVRNYCLSKIRNDQENVMEGTNRKPVHLIMSSLYPPKPTDPAPTTRDRPAGCKTICVRGLPERATEEIIKEVFERCGEIQAVRMSGKDFCNIRFTKEAYVESAICYSGYRMKIGNQDDLLYTGRLQVDYVQTREDEYEYKCQQRAKERDARHKLRHEEEYYKAPSPASVRHYSELEASIIAEKIRHEETFQQAVFILNTWLERGECDRRTVDTFFSMIQSTNSHVRRLMNEKLKYKDELNKAKLMLTKKNQGILLQLNEIMKVFKTATLQKVWDHFTKAQRKNIDLWKKQTEEIKNAHVKEVLNDRIEDEMDLSEDEQEKNEDESKKTSDTSDEKNKSEEELNRLKEELNKLKDENETIRCQLEAAVNKDEGVSKETSDTSDQKNKFEEELNKLKEENETIRCQLEAAVNETAVLRSDSEFKEQHIQRLVEALQNSTKILNQKRVAEEAEFKEPRTLKSKRIMDKDDHLDGSKDHYESDNDNICQVSTTSSDVNISEREARLMSLISTFLHKHPFGANVDYIYLYLNNIDSTIQPREFQSLMKRFPLIYREDLTGIVASLG